MNTELIREIVRITIDELTNRKLIKTDDYQSVLKVIEAKLYQYFSGDCEGIGNALIQLSDDPYIDIIFLQYRDGKTLEWIAEYFNRDSSTIKRNKKRLISRIYEFLEEQ